MNVGVLEPEPGIDVRSDFAVGFDDILDVRVDEVIERIYMLLDETFYFEKCR